MTTTRSPIAVGVFQDEAQAQQAMSDLQQAGFTNDQIRYSVHKGGAGILDSLTGLGIPQQEASYYNSEFEAGRTVVTVNASDRQQEAFDILSRNGGYNATTAMGQSTATYGQAADTYAKDRTLDTNRAERVQLREEQLEVNKQPVQTGEVGIRKEVVTEQKSINVPVNREEVVIERRPDGVVFERVGRDGVRRTTEIALRPAPDAVQGTTLVIERDLTPQQVLSLFEGQRLGRPTRPPGRSLDQGRHVPAG